MDRTFLSGGFRPAGLAIALVILATSGIAVAGSDGAPLAGNGGGSAAANGSQANVAAGSPRISAIGLHQAVPHSNIEQIAVYLTAMRQALAIKDPQQRKQAIDRARAQLSTASDRPMTPEAAARVDSLLGLDVMAPAAAPVQR